MPLPLKVGAALTLADLPRYADWILSQQRDLEMQDPCAPDFLDGDWQATARQIRNLLGGYTGRMGVHAPYFSVSLAIYDAKVRLPVVERYQQALDFSAAIGARQMVVHSPLDFLGAPVFSPRDSQQFRDAYAQTLMPIAQHAAQVGVTLVIENISDRDPQLWRRLAAEVNLDCVRLSVDVGHAYLAHVQHRAPTPDQWLHTGGDLLQHVHLQDNDGYGDRHWAMGDGNLNWRSIFNALVDLPSLPQLIIEVNDPDDIARSYAWLSAQGLAI